MSQFIPDFLLRFAAAFRYGWINLRGISKKDRDLIRNENTALVSNLLTDLSSSVGHSELKLLKDNLSKVREENEKLRMQICHLEANLAETKEKLAESDSDFESKLLRQENHRLRQELGHFRDQSNVLDQTIQSLKTDVHGPNPPRTIAGLVDGSVVTDKGGLRVES